MPRPKPDEENVVVSFRVKQSGAVWLEAEAKRRKITRTDLCREIFRLGMSEYNRSGRK